MEQAIQNAMNETIIQEAAKRYGVDPLKIHHVGGFENFIYEYEINGDFFIMRFAHSLHRTYDLILGEIEFIDYLAKNKAAVSTIVRSKQDALSEKIMIDEQAYFTVSVFTKAPGTFVKKEDLTDAFFMQLGQQVGQMHRLTKDFHPRHKRQEFYEDEYIDLGRKYLPLEKQFIVDKTIALINKIKAYDRGVDSYGLIHTDLHFGNMFYDGTSITFFDFDDASYKHFISDIAIIIFYLYGLTPLTDSEIEEKTANLLKWFFKGYEKENTLDKVWFTRLNDFLKLRELVLYLVIYAAGEDMLKSPFGTFYIKKFEERIMTDQAFFDINRVLNLWNS